MSNRTSTAISHKVYDSRALFTHKFNTKNTVITPSGDLYALIQEAPYVLDLKKSSDGGFSWDKLPIAPWTTYESKPRTQTDWDANGPCNHLVVSPKLNKGYMFMSQMNVGGSFLTEGFRIQCIPFDLDDVANTDPTTDGIKINASNAPRDELFTVTSNAKTAFIVSTSGGVILQVNKLNLIDNTQAGPYVEATLTPLAQYSAVADEDSFVHIAVAISNGASADSISYIKFDGKDNTYSGETILALMPNTSTTSTDITIAQDSYGTLCVAWGEVNGSDVELKYATSTDAVTWTQNSIAKEAGQTAFVDAIKGTPSTRTDIIAGIEGGFLISYTRTVSGSPESYVKSINTVDGITYVAQTEKVAQIANMGVSGVKFFKPCGSDNLNIEDPALVRVAFQVGEGNNTIQNDSVPVTIDQDLLVDAYPYTPTITNVLDNNIDFYANGNVGVHTTKSEKAFAATSSTYKLHKYEPIANSSMNDRSAYSAPVESTVAATLEPETYRAPARVTDTNSLDSYVERDIRKVHLHPNTHLSRTFLLNKGNHLKRTVWIMSFAGNEYELTQVVPHFINNEIVHYEVNAYIVGPSNDPFSRKIYPSET